MQDAQLDVTVKESHCITGAYCGLHTHIFNSILDFHWDAALMNLPSGNLFAGRRLKFVVQLDHWPGRDTLRYRNAVNSP